MTREGVAGEVSPGDEFRTDVPHPARVYDYWLGGKDNYAADREVAEKLMAALPGVRASVRANREFLKKAVRSAAAAGVRQFIDIGSGLPTVENVHEIAQRVTPGARVVYVDNDPIVRVHGQALLATTGSTSVVQADLREPDAILTHPEVRALIDFGQPVAVMLLGVLHFVPDDETAEIMARLTGAMTPESQLIVSHLTADSDPVGIESFINVLKGSPGTAVSIPRTRDQVAAFFDDCKILDPGVVPVHQWPADAPATDDPFWLWAAVGRKA